MRGDKPRSHEGTGSGKRETHIEKNLEIMMKLNQTGSSRRDTHGQKPGNHDETRSSTRETKKDKPAKHDETGSNKRDKGRQTWKS